MASYSIDAEKFIYEIKKHKELWDLDVNGRPYRIRVKEQAWAKVARVFIQDFETLSKPEKSEVYRKLYNKWRNIRDAYVRNIRGTRHQSEYIFMQQLAFLNNRYNRLHSKTDEKSSDDDEAKNNDETVNNSAESDEDTPSVIDNLKRRRLAGRRTTKIEIVNRQNSELSDPVCGPQDGEKRRINRQIERVDTPQSSEFDSPLLISRVNEESSNDIMSARSFDEDRSFFDSLLPAVREFDMDQKLKFRYEVLRIIKDIRSSVQSNCKPEPSSVYYLEQ